MLFLSFRWNVYDRLRRGEMMSNGCDHRIYWISQGDRPTQMKLFILFSILFFYRFLLYSMSSTTSAHETWSCDAHVFIMFGSLLHNFVLIFIVFFHFGFDACCIFCLLVLNNIFEFFFSFSISFKNRRRWNAVVNETSHGCALCGHDDDNASAAVAASSSPETFKDDLWTSVSRW